MFCRLYVRWLLPPLFGDQAQREGGNHGSWLTGFVPLDLRWLLPPLFGDQAQREGGQPRVKSGPVYSGLLTAQSAGLTC